MPLHLKKMYKNAMGYLFYSKKEPFEIKLFEDYFVRTYYDICQVMGEDCGLTRIPTEYLVMAARI